MKLVWSNPLKLNVVGAGRPYGYLAKYLLETQKKHEVKFISGYDLVNKMYGGSTPPPESLEQGSLSDIIASLDEDLHCDVFLGTGCASLAQMQRMRIGIECPRDHIVGVTGAEYTPKIITTWFNSHFKHANDILTEEYGAMRIFKQAIDPFLMWRDIFEQKWSDLLIVPSEACAETYEKVDYCKGKTRVAGFGVDTNIFKPPEIFKVDDGPRFLYSGGNWIRKGLQYLVKAWNQLKPKGYLTILSVDPHQFPMLPRTAFQGWVPDEQVPKYYQVNHVYCSPSLEEGQALAVLEAMASGLAIIATRESGAPIEDGKEGLIIPARSPEKIRDALQYFQDNPNEIDRMGKNALQKAQTLTWQKFGERVIEICEEAASK